MALAYAVWLNLIARDRAGHFGKDREKQAAVGRTMHPGMKQTRRNEQGTQALVAAGWSAASFRIRTADGWLEVDGIVRSAPLLAGSRLTGSSARRSASTSGPPTRPATGAGL
ncbi:MAG: hypothetical protein K0S42_3628 [Microvirga sp.]|nr:hypothetical protein [Microvirga sp.]